jgi:hypothetical protein
MLWEAGATPASGLVAAWVKAHFTATTVGGKTVYDLTSHRS